jgi:hypothetical protein
LWVEHVFRFYPLLAFKLEMDFAMPAAPLARSVAHAACLTNGTRNSLCNLSDDAWIRRANQKLMPEGGLGRVRVQTRGTGPVLLERRLWIVSGSPTIRELNPKVLGNLFISGLLIENR